MFIEANLTATTRLGLIRNRLVGQPISKFIIEEDQDCYYLFRKHLFATGEPQVCELRMVKSDGSIFWVHLSATIARNEDDAPVCRLVLIDITERKRAEAELHQRCDELERINNLMVDRELRMIELKSEVNALLNAAAQPDKYKIIGEND